MKQKKNQKQTKIYRLHGIENEEQLTLHKIILDKIARSKVPDYKWTKEIGEVATNLIYYFNGIEKQYDLNKAIAIVGDYGLGKSMLMNIFKEYLKSIVNPNKNIYRITSTEEILFEMRSVSFMKSRLLYNNQPYDDTQKPINIMINEFGAKYDGKSYGTDYQELIEMFLMKRYDIFQQYGKLTHVTTNYDTKALQTMFEPKIIDRFKEMFTFIPLKGKSFRK